MATALDALESEDRERLAEANRAFMAMFEFVPQDEFEAELAEHKAALEAGAEQSPAQQRAAEQTAFDPGWGTSPTVTRGGLGVPLTPSFSDPPPPAPEPAVVEPAPGGWADYPGQPPAPY